MRSGLLANPYGKFVSYVQMRSQLLANPDQICLTDNVTTFDIVSLATFVLQMMSGLLAIQIMANLFHI